MQITKVQTSLHIGAVGSVPLLFKAGWFEYDLVGNPKDRFSQDKAQILQL